MDDGGPFSHGAFPSKRVRWENGATNRIHALPGREAENRPDRVHERFLEEKTDLHHLFVLKYNGPKSTRGLDRWKGLMSYVMENTIGFR
jgi:hypothetical protein